MTEHPITQAQDHDRRIACPCENRGLEGIAEQLDRRLDAIERALAEFRTEVTRRMDSQFRWTVGLLFGVVGLQLTSLLKVLN